MIAIIDAGFSFIKFMVIDKCIVVDSLATDSMDALVALYKCYSIDCVVLFGVNAYNVKAALDVPNKDIIEVSEIECNGYLSEHYDIKPAIVVSFGSGVNFTKYDGSKVEFVTGSGWGSCALKQLYRLIFPTQSFFDSLQMAAKGNNHNVNIEMRETNLELSSWLREESTMINLGRHSDNDCDISLGILRSFLDHINTHIRAILHYERIKDIVITGGIFKTTKVKELLKYNLFDLNCIIPIQPEFGACIGAYYLYTIKIKYMDKIILNWKEK